MTASGLIVGAIIGYVAVWMVGVLNNPTPDGAQFTGSRQQLLVVLELLGMLIAFGAGAVLVGGWQLIVGRRNRVLS